MTTANVDFTFSDTIAGYVTGYDDETDSFGLRTSDGREFQAYFTKNTYAQAMRNFGEAYLDTTGQMRDLLVPDRHIFAYGIFPEMEDRLAAEGVRLHALCTWWDVLAEARRRDAFDPETLAAVEAYLHDPEGWVPA